MECNKDDSIKAKEVAERKLNAKDVAGAKKFALKAQALFPELEGISQLLSTLNVYESAGNRIYGEADWYGILGTEPQADEITIRKHYRKLALMLHPDKNKSAGAEGAFKLVSEAWSLLSDKNKRAAYDAKRHSKGFPPTAKQPPAGSSSMPRGSDGFYNFVKTAATSNVKVNKNSSHANGASSGSTSKTNCGSFWTVCHSCMTHYEYKRIYLNLNLVCPKCKKPFLAIETPPPASNGPKSAKPWNSAPQYSHQGSSGSNVTPNLGNFQWTPFSGDARASSVAQAANVVHQTYEKVKRVREEAQAARKREKAAKRKSYASENKASSSVEKKRRVNMGINDKQTGPGISTGKHNVFRTCATFSI